MPVILLVAIALSLGFIVSFLTGLILGTKKATGLPGGSIIAATYAGWTFVTTYELSGIVRIETLIAAGGLGLIGHAIYCYYTQKNNKA